MPSRRKLAIGAGGIFFASGFIYFRVAEKEPFEKIEGSLPLRNKNKLNFQDKQLSLQGFLKQDHLYSQNYQVFDPSIRKYLEIPISPRRVEESGNLFKAFNSLKGWNRTASTISDRDLSYRDNPFIGGVNSLKKEEIIRDILESILDESEYLSTLIRADSIKIEFKKEEGFSLVKDFNLRLRILNPRKRKAYLFKSIEIDPLSENDIHISLSQSEIKPTTVSVNLGHSKQISWSLFPKDSVWKITKITHSPNHRKTEETKFSLPLIYGTSAALKDLQELLPRKEVDHPFPIASSLDYGYVREKLTPLLVNISENQMEKDIEAWFGAHKAHQIRVYISDLQNLIEMFKKRSFLDKNGRKASLIEMVMKSHTFKDGLYNHMKLSSSYRKVLDSLLTSEGKELKLTEEECYALLDSWSYQLKQMQDSIKISITWDKKPQRVIQPLGYTSPYPAVSFKFKQKISFEKAVKIPLNGSWDSSQKKYDASSGDQKFDITKRLSSLGTILAPIRSVFKEMGNGGSFMGADIFDVLMPDVSQFLGIDGLEIDANEYIENIYEASNSPIGIAIGDSEDYQGINIKGKNIGWKALDVSSSINLANFSKFFYKLYEKIDTYKDPSNSALGVSQLWNFTTLLQQRPISFIIHAIHSTFDHQYLKSGSSTPEDKRPWPVFFKSLFQDPITIKHKQVFVGYSGAFFDVKEWFRSETKSSEQYSTSWDISTKKQRDEWEILSPKNEDVALINQKFALNYSSFSPEQPIIINSEENKSQYDAFLAKEGSTSIGLVNHYDRLKSVFRDNNKSNIYYPNIDWENMKVSYAQLNLEKAIKSVLAIRHTFQGFPSSLVLTTLGIEIHKILGEALIRNPFWINMNFMKEIGSWSKNEIPFKYMSYSVYSEESLYITPQLDKTKLNLGRFIKL
ncbi:hypothetical protein HF1_06800 [Mycoplasma haemofelis str. Langford 1]|uniref:Uncharacterized protein n=1 Tax=Mycoplasma haemofelis (strain Langford 1) TaxID=941640 RepID=E8ZHR7_MYCHL|nr:hypothetical protein [Mycoplasma haemofelis]CBY92688.1 hypothetical protein HF1_06800 [Mycoplasma haemofelis str. Langford 1]